MMAARRTPRDATAARHAFRRAEPVAADDAVGDWRLEWVLGEVGRASHHKVLVGLGLRGLVGLRLSADGLEHLVGGRRLQRAEAVRPVPLADGDSAVDGRPALVAGPPPDEGLPWRLVRRELRRLDAERLVGVELLGPPRLAVPLPFVLHREPSAPGADRRSR